MDSNIKPVIADVISNESSAISNIPLQEDMFREARSIIFLRVHKLGGKVVTSGVGKAGQVAMNIATMFSSTGTPSVFVHPVEAMHGDLGILQEHDVLLLVSNSGKTDELVSLIELSRTMYPVLEIILITGNPVSRLGDLSDVILSTGYPDEVCIHGLAPTTSTTAMMVIGDVLLVLMEKAIDFTKEEYYLRHHKGYIKDKEKTNEDNT